MDRGSIIDAIRNRKKPWDIVVIGGGATGVGCALDAATRGLDVLLLEQHDLGKGTSSRSTKLIHGGVRYLRQGNISLVREALRERGILLKNAPHAVSKQAFVIPCYTVRQKLIYGLGLRIYDLLAGKHGIGRSKPLSHDEVIERLPNIAKRGLAGGILYYDGQFEDARLLIDIALTAQRRGALILNYARVTEFVTEGGERIREVRFEDLETGQSFTVNTKSVINAAGIFSDSVRALGSSRTDRSLTFSQGIHLVLDKSFLPSDSALMIPKTRDGRVLFCIPWHGRLLIGTTDTPIESPMLEPEAQDVEIDFLLETVGEYLKPQPTRADILSVFAGVRPLISSTKARRTSAISRGHHLFVDESGMVTITGGKWTTYRQMAEDAVDRVVEIGGLPRRLCVTAVTPIIDSRRGGNEESLQDVEGLRNVVIQAVRHEFARTVEDILARRTRTLLLDPQTAIELSRPAAQIMAEELGNDVDWVDYQVREFAQTARAFTAREAHSVETTPSPNSAA